MYFPSDMNFQYFFFDTYPGFFLQALPAALLAGMISVIWQRKRRAVSAGKAILPSLFVAYLTGLLCITLFSYLLGDFYFLLFYRHMPGGASHWFCFEYDFVPDFFKNFGIENLGNILIFLPFGLLYPFFNRRATWKRTVLAGGFTSLSIELLQPVFGRSFDVNDLILNGFGVLLSAGLFWGLKSLLRRKQC